MFRERAEIWTRWLLRRISLHADIPNGPLIQGVIEQAMIEAAAEALEMSGREYAAEQAILTAQLQELLGILHDLADTEKVIVQPS